MKRIFLDTNVVLDYLLQREPFTLIAQQLISAAQLGRTEALVSSLTMATAHYIGRKPLGQEGILAALTALSHHITVVDVSGLAIAQALRAGMPDFEDAIQLYSALAAGADTIVTRDPRGFTTQLLPILDPLAALARL